MTFPKIDLAPTPTVVQDWKRTEILMEIEEEDKGIPKRIRDLISSQEDLKHLTQVSRKIQFEYGEGRLSDKLFKRARGWAKKRWDELQPSTVRPS